MVVSDNRHKGCPLNLAVNVTCKSSNASEVFLAGARGQLGGYFRGTEAPGALE